MPVQVIAWSTVSKMTYNVSSETLNLTLTHSLNSIYFKFHYKYISNLA